MIVRSHHGTFAITTVSKINNMDELVAGIMKKTGTHFLEMSGGSINATELVATLINQKDNLIEGIQYAQQCVEGSLSLMIMTPQGIYVARDKVGRTPMILGKKAEGFCATFESTAYLRHHDAGRCAGAGKTRIQNEGLHVYVGVLRISVFFL